MTYRQKSKDSLESVATAFPYNKRKIALAIIITAVSVSIAIEIGFIAIHTKGYSSASATMDSYKNALCTTKILDLSQKGVIRDAAGFNGGIFECMHVSSANSIYGDVFSTHQG